jgi:hypothetical protein
LRAKQNLTLCLDPPQHPLGGPQAAATSGLWQVRSCRCGRSHDLGY